MEEKQITWANLKVGIVILIGLVIFVFIISIVGTEQNVFTPTYSLKLFMPNVHGLVSGGMVSLGGLKVGYVKELQFTTKDGVNGIEIRISILTKHRSSITTSSVAQIKTIGLLGDKYIDITIGNQSEQPLAEYSFIPLKESFDIEDAGPEFKAAISNFTDLLRDAKKITSSVASGEGSVGRLVKDPSIAHEMERFLRSLNGLMTAVEEKKGSVGKLVYDDSLSRNISVVASNLKNVTDQISRGKGTMGKLIMDDLLYNNLSSFSARADSLMSKASNDSSNVSRLISDGNFYNQLLKLMRDLNILLIDLKEHPERYVRVSVF